MDKCNGSCNSVDDLSAKKICVLNKTKSVNVCPFIFSLDRCNGSCNSVNDLSAKICVPNKTKGVNVKVFNMLTKITEAKTLIAHISCDCKCKFNSTTYKSY